MNGHFSLQPFLALGSSIQSATSPSLGIKLIGNINRPSNALVIHYALLAPLDVVEIPTLAGTPTRKNGLWEETCFEFFLGIKNSPRYWEFNLSPAGHWNIYCFAAYRQGMREEMAYTSLPFSVQKQSDSLSLVLNLDLDEIVQADQALEIAISAVIKFKEGEQTYWALTHPGPQADFHRRDSFTIEL